MIITNCYNTGNISGGNSIGGINGSIGDTTITNCYSCGTVTGSSHVGGIVGNASQNVVNNSYYDSDVSGLSDTGNGEPKTTAEMKSMNTFLPEWDILLTKDIKSNTDSIWGIDG